MDYAAGFIFMRRMGSAALTSTGPVLNVLPLAVHIDARETLADLAMRLAAQLKKMRRHQRYDAEQIVRDSGKAAGDEPLFGPVLNVKVFDYQLDIDGVQAVTHTLATGPVNDLELALFPDETGGLSLEILANKARYDEAELRRHMARLTALLAQFAADPTLRCGAKQRCSPPTSWPGWRRSTIPLCRCLPPPSARWWPTRRGRPRMRRRWRTPAGSSAIARCVSRWWRSRSCCVSAA